MKLLDVNGWLAAVWARHRHHATAKQWVDNEEDDLAFCRVTEMSLLRLVTNPAVLGTDADYLAAFAHAAQAELVTLDGGLRSRYPGVRVTCLT